MKKAIFPLILFFAFLTVFILQAFYPSPFPENKVKQLLAKSNFLNLQYPQEKIYLHLDRPSYWSNDDIWFKAYLRNSPIPDCNLYVELINSSGTVMQKKILWAQNGLAYGDFHTADTITSGVYQIRAYTNWMRNFGEGWFFRKDLVILNIRDKVIDGVAISLTSKDIDFQFLPEGGIFLANVTNRMAFKAIDQNGKGLDVKGKVLDDQGNEVVKFKSLFKGMGSFLIQPQEGRKYAAEVIVADNIPMTIDLPNPQVEGVTLAINPNDSSNVHIQIAQTPSATVDSISTQYLLVGQTNGVVFYRKEITMKKDSYNYDIEKFKLPTGIIQFTLFDQDVIPRCERLVFINHHDFVNLEIKPDKSSYLTREKVQLDVNAMTAEGLPCLANLSMSVYNPEAQLKTEDYPNNILSHFLLNSELKGTIEDAAYYLKDDSLTTLLALDNLMLTHGYRHFEWKEIVENKFPNISYLPEGSITIKGKVENMLLKKTIPDCKVTMLFVKNQNGLYEQTTDSLGHFSFSNLFFNDTAFVSLQAVNSRGKNNTWIELDERSAISPKVSSLPVTYQYIKEKPTNTTTYLSEVSSELINKKWHLSDTILLGDINIVRTKVKKNDGHIRIYADADFVFDVTKQDDVYGNIFGMMDGRIPGVRYEESDKLFYIRGNAVPAQLMLDGVPVEADLISTLPASSFDKIEILKFAPMIGSKGNNGAIFFYSKAGIKFENLPIDKQGMKSATIIGYSVIRKFYSPQYITNVNSSRKTDFRSTLYWNPIVRTDSTGVANVSFYNSDQSGEVDVVVEGVTADGKLCRGLCRYNVTY